jgi:hypothetical protein
MEYECGRLVCQSFRGSPHKATYIDLVLEGAPVISGRVIGFSNRLTALLFRSLLDF